MNHQFDAFIDDLKATHGKNLASVTLYGSAAAGGPVRKQSDYNLLIALDKITPEELRNAHGCIREWVKLGHPVPAYFTVRELENAADVFPIEFRQMERARKVLYGSDVLAGVEISDENLRHQVEFELRSKLLMLRRRYIPASASVEGLMTLMSSSLASFIALFRGALMLKGLEPPADRHGTIALAVQHLGLNGVPLEKIFNIHGDNFSAELTETEANQLFADYMEQIERVIDTVDALDGSQVGIIDH